MKPVNESAGAGLPADLYHVLFDEATVGIFIIDQSSRLVDVNQRLVAFCGYTRDELVNQPVDQLFIADLPDLKSLENKTPGQPWAGECQLRCKNGQTYLVELTILVLTNGYFEAIVRDNAERRRSEEALRQSEERYRNLFENTPIPVWEEDFYEVKRLFDRLKNEGVRDLDEHLTRHPELVWQCAEMVRITDVNRAGMVVHGVESKDELKGTLSGLFTPESYGSFRSELLALWEGKKEIRQDNAVQGPGGHLRESAIHLLVSPVHEENLSSVLVSSVDITERNQMERALRESEEKFRLIIEQSAEGVALIDEEGNIIEWNQANERITGLKRQDVMSVPFWDIQMALIPPDKQSEQRREEIKSAVLEALNTGISYLFSRPFESEYFPAGGKEVRFFHQIIFPIKTEKGYRIAGLSHDITERKLAEEALRSASLYVRSLIEASLDPLVMINPDGKITDANRAAEEATGILRLRLVGSDFCDYFTEPQKARLAYQEALSEGLVKDFPLTIRHISGQTTQVLYNATVYKNADGRVEGVFADARDISAIKLAEDELARHRNHLEELVAERTRQLQQSEQRFRSLFDRMSEGFEINQILFDEQGKPSDYRILEVNPAFEHLTGLRREDVIGRLHSEILPDDDPYWLEIYGEVVLDNQTVHFQNYSSALKQYYEVYAYPLGENRYADLFLNITERKQGEELLLRQSHILTAINRILHETLTCETDRDIANVFLEVSREITGSRFGFVYEIDAEGEMDSVLLSHVKVDNNEGAFTDPDQQFNSLEPGSYWRRVFDLGRSQILNHPETDPDYPESPGDRDAMRRFLGVPLRNNQKISGLVGLANKESDYTQADLEAIEAISPAFVEALNRKRAERAIQELNIELGVRAAALEAANKELEAFAYSVSHDLRAPLRHIDGFLELLEERLDGTLDEKSRHYMATISNAAQQMGRLIDDLLLFSRLGRQEMRKSQVILGQLVQEVIEEFEPELRARIVRWQVYPLPQVVGDRDMLRSVLVNLIGNALKFTRSRETAEVEIGALDGDEKEITIYVRDNGIGFDMAYASKLFGIFQRLHLKGPHEGNGMGLASVRRLIDRHGGRTWAEGKVDQGATIYFSLPRRHPTGTLRS